MRRSRRKLAHDVRARLQPLSAPDPFRPLRTEMRGGDGGRSVGQEIGQEIGQDIGHMSDRDPLFLFRTR
jgi:hypothetical protein